MQVTTNKNDKNIYIILFNKYKGECAEKNISAISSFREKQVLFSKTIAQTEEYSNLSGKEQLELYAECLNYRD